MMQYYMLPQKKPAFFFHLSLTSVLIAVFYHPITTAPSLSLSLFSSFFLALGLVYLEHVESVLYELSTYTCIGLFLAAFLYDRVHVTQILHSVDSQQVKSAAASVLVGAIYWSSLLNTMASQSAVAVAFALVAGSLLGSVTSLHNAFLCIVGISVLVSHPLRQSWAVQSTTFRRISSGLLVVLLAISLLALTFSANFGRRFLKEVASPSLKNYPIHEVIDSHRADFDRFVKGQSANLDECAHEYMRRYAMHPPPNFDQWFKFATENGVINVDEYDTVFRDLQPFWGIPPHIIRVRALEAFQNPAHNILGIVVRAGAIKQVVNGKDDWFSQALVGMMSKFVEHLPDMEIAFNLHDEPRVIVPADQINRNIAAGGARGESATKNTFTPVGRGIDVINDSSVSHFNFFAHQPTWSHSTQSCQVDSPARLHGASDNTTSFARWKGGIVFNKTASSDICLMPSLETSYGFFDRPNAFNIIQSFYPIFSQSKISSFSDIVYPSPWYWSQQVKYVAENDVPWDEKSLTLYWRGSTTGGFSRAGGWRHQHRQKMMALINSTIDVWYLDHQSSEWVDERMHPKYLRNKTDVKFSYIGQCDPQDCEEQRHAFNISERVVFDEAYKSRWLLDIDGNAFSGRFYAFLNSASAVVKIALFREWHDDFLFPWVHYIPVSIGMREIWEVVRWLGTDEHDATIARQGREWSRKSLRTVDMEAWFFRLLLEYARVTDDARHEIGCCQL